MSPRQSTQRTAIFGVVWLVTFSGCFQIEQPVSGVVVESCNPGEAAAVAGLEAGDVLLEWRQGSSNGDVASPFHLALVEQELAPHGPVEMTVVRDARRQSIAIPIGRWQLRSRPVMSPEALADHLRAQDLAAAGEVDRAIEVWTNRATTPTDDDRTLVPTWLHFQAGVALATVGRADESLTAFDRGASRITDKQLLAAYWEQAGDALMTVGQTRLAAEAIRTALEILESGEPASPALAFALLQLCRSDLRNCGDRAAQGLEIYTRSGKETIETATALSNVASVAFFRSDLEAAEGGYRRALEIVHETAPGSPTELNLLGNLGLVAMRRGDFDTARSYFRREQAAAENLDPGSLQYAHASNYLGLLAKNLGRYDEAQIRFEQALRAFQSTRPDGVEVAGVLSNLGIAARYRENFRAARGYHEEALRLRRSFDAESTDVASSLHNIGSIAWRQGDLSYARQCLESALELKSRSDTGSLWIATTHSELGELARIEGAPDRSADHHLLALAIRRRVAPHHPDVISSLIQLGTVELDRGRPDAAETRWREAVGLIEAQRRRHHLSEDQRAQFKARYRQCYLSLANLMIDQGRTVEGWNLLEQARAGALRAAVANRGSAPGGVPPELWFAKTRAESRAARIENRLARLDPNVDEAALLEFRAQLELVEAELEDLTKQIQTAAPAFADLENTEALTLGQLQVSLSTGTVVVFYAVGEDRTTVMVTRAAIDRDSVVETFSIPEGQEALGQRVGRFNSLIARGASTAEVEGAVLAQARKLHDLLLGPAAETVAGAKRVLIVPDGPLHELSFAALVLPGEPARFLGHAKSIYVNPSASLAVALGSRSDRSSPSPRTIVAFGDPEYPPTSPFVEEHHLSPLPGSRAEIEAIRRIFGPPATVFLGRAASEANLKAHGGGTDILHCAVHARVDPNVAMDSALFFSPPADPVRSSDDGSLSAWEIIDSLHLDSALVVLSSCSTARGRVVPGEGIIGLARAFQVAGARTVVVSQWPVPDRSTALLMTTFYKQLAEGRSTAEALHGAQEIVANTPKFAHPYHWAAFQVRGDWR